MELSAKEQEYEAEVIQGIQSYISELEPIDWNRAWVDIDYFDDLAWALTNLDNVDYGKARSWFFDNFEDTNEELEAWVKQHFGDNWAKIAHDLEW